MTGFTDKQIISMLGIHSFWSKRACREILRRPGDFIPLLIDILNRTIHDPESLDDKGDDPHIPATLMMATMMLKSEETTRAHVEAEKNTKTAACNGD